MNKAFEQFLKEDRKINQQIGEKRGFKRGFKRGRDKERKLAIHALMARTNCDFDEASRILKEAEEAEENSKTA